MLILFLATVVVSLSVIGPWGQFPLNDDWVYTKNVVNTLASGQFTVSSGQYAYAIPQVLLGLLAVKPGEEPFLALRWIGITAGIGSAIAVSFLCIKAQNIKSSILFFLACLATFFFVPCLQTSVSFMTDMPAFFFWVLSVWTLGKFLEKKSFVTWLVAFLTYIVALSERQLAFLIPLSVLIFQNRKFRLREGWEGAVHAFKQSLPLLVFFIPVVAIHLWWIRISPVKKVPLSLSPNPGVLIRMLYHLIHLGWFAVPFAFVPKIQTSDLTPAQRKLFRASMTFLLVSLIITVIDSLIYKRLPLPPFFSNVLSEVGILPIVLGGFTEVIFFIKFRLLLLVTGFLGAFQILKGFSIVWIETSTSQLKRVILLSSVAYFIFICFRSTHFDRYIIPVIPLCLLCLLRVCKLQVKLSFFRMTAIVFSGVLYAAFSSTLIADYFRWNEARWKAIDYAKSRGIPRNDLWGGYEYFGWYDILELWGRPSNQTYVIRPSYPSDQFEKLEGFPYKAFWNREQKEMYLLKRKEKGS